MNVWLVGAGAIGGTLASQLVRAGTDLTVVDANPDHVDRLRDPGIEVTWPADVLDFDDTLPGETTSSEADDGTDSATVTVTRLDANTPAEAAERLDGPCDVLLLAVRSAVTEQALAPYVDHLASDGVVVSVQNGLNESRIAASVGPERTVGCVVGFGATYLGPGRVEVTSTGEFVIGSIDDTTIDLLPDVQGLLERAFPTRITDTVLGALWGKMIINSTTVLGATCGYLLGELLCDPVGRRVARQTVAESVDVASHEAGDLPYVFELVDPSIVAHREDGWEAQLDRAFDFVAEHFGDIKSVTLRDIELGRSIEVDAVTGEIVRRGNQAGIDVPVNEAVYELLEAIDRGDRSVDPANLEELERAIPT